MLRLQRHSFVAIEKQTRTLTLFEQRYSERSLELLIDILALFSTSILEPRILGEHSCFPACFGFSLQGTSQASQDLRECLNLAKPRQCLDYMHLIQGKERATLEEQKINPSGRTNISLNRRYGVCKSLLSP